MSDVDTLTLAEFLLARIAEDEARVKAPDGSWPDWGWRYRESGVMVWSDERALAECEAKRKIVERCQLAYQLYLDGFAHEILADDVLEQLATPYADHPDYRAEWKPESR